MIASGWSLKFGQLVQIEGYLYTIFSVFMIQIIIAFVSSYDDGEHHKFHDYSGLPGLLLILIRLGIFFQFMRRSAETEAQMPRKYKSFFKLLKVSSAVYLLSFPILYFLTWAFVPYKRYRVMYIGHYFAQIVAFWGMLRQFTKKGSKY